MAKRDENFPIRKCDPLYFASTFRIMSTTLQMSYKICGGIKSVTISVFFKGRSTARWTCGNTCNLYALTSSMNTWGGYSYRAGSHTPKPYLSRSHSNLNQNGALYYKTLLILDSKIIVSSTIVDDR